VGFVGKYSSVWTRHRCIDGKWQRTGHSIPTEQCNTWLGGSVCFCLNTEICRQSGNSAKCVTQCEQPQNNSKTIGVTNDTSTQADDIICTANLVNHSIMFVYARDPNAKSVDAPGDVLPGQTLTYTVEYENEGAGTAYGVYILDELDTDLSETTLTINNEGAYSEASRRLNWELGELDAGEQGLVTYSIDIKDDLPSGTEIINIADVHFPSADEITPTNPVVSVVKSVVADPQTVSTVAGTSLAITLTGGDSGSNPLTFRLINHPSYGAITGTAPNLTYSPMPEFSGQDTFTFVVNNGLVDSESAMVRINVTPDPLDINPPVVLETDPPSGAQSIHISQDAIYHTPEMYGPTIKATFSEPMDADTITTNTFMIEGLGGEVAYDQLARTVLFSPSSAFAYGTTYTAHLNTSITDLAGNTLASTYSWQFTTQSQINIVATIPENASAINFGTMEVNAAPEESIISLMNTGPLDLMVTSITITGENSADFGIVEDNCSGTAISEFENETIRVNFKPISVGSKQAALSVLSNDPDTPDLRIDLIGIASTDQNDDSGDSGGGGGGGGGCFINSLRYY